MLSKLGGVSTGLGKAPLAMVSLSRLLLMENRSVRGSIPWLKRAAASELMMVQVEFGLLGKLEKGMTVSAVRDWFLTTP